MDRETMLFMALGIDDKFLLLPLFMDLDFDEVRPDGF
jgi:hypothetical protein